MLIHTFMHIVLHASMLIHTLMHILLCASILAHTLMCTASHAPMLIHTLMHIVLCASTFDMHHLVCFHTCPYIDTLCVVCFHACPYSDIYCIVLHASMCLMYLPYFHASFLSPYHISYIPCSLPHSVPWICSPRLHLINTPGFSLA